MLYKVLETKNKISGFKVNVTDENNILAIIIFSAYANSCVAEIASQLENNFRLIVK